MTSVPGFLTKTFEIFSSPEYADCCGWGPNGDTIIIRKIEQFSKQILPKYFKHSNFQSFVRQLNMYDFHKTVQDPNHGEFQHQYFRQNQPELLIYIKRKANNRGTEALKKFSSSTSKQPSSNQIVTTPSSSSAPPSSSHHSHLQTAGIIPHNGTSVGHDGLLIDAPFSSDALTKLLPEDIVQETDSVFLELEQQKLMREEFEKRMEEKLSKVEGENQVLKRLFFESHQKNLVLQERMERVLKTLYSVFVSGQAGKTLTGRMPSMLITDYPPPSNSAQPLKAILDTPAIEEEDSKSSKRRSSSRQNKGANQYDLDSAALDLSSFEKLPSIDFGNSSSSLNGNSSVEQYMQIKNSLAGKELSRSDRMGITSFDHAAASVAPPLKYLPSLDSTYFPTNEFNIADDNNSLLKSTNGSENYHSDRVTLLSEDTDNSLLDSSGMHQGRTSHRSEDTRSRRGSSLADLQAPPDYMETMSTSHSDSQLQSRGTKRNRNQDGGLGDQAISSPLIATPSEFLTQSEEKRRRVDSYAENPPNNPLTNLAPPGHNTANTRNSSEDIQLMDLLHRNQDSTLTRLDSLEQTIATLLEGIEYDDLPVDDAAAIGDEAVTDDKPLEAMAGNGSETLSLSDTASSGRNYSKLSALAVSSTSQMYSQEDDRSSVVR